MTAVFQQLYYSVEEDAGSVEACVAIVSATAGTLASMGTVTVIFTDISASM